MAYMTNQWLKSLPQRWVFHYPVSVDIKDLINMDNFEFGSGVVPEDADSNQESWKEKMDIVFTLELEKKEEAGYGYGEALVEKMYQRIYFTQSDVEFLLKNLLIKTSRDIKLETKLELIKLLNMNHEEVMKYISDNYNYKYE